jgi:Fur family peroxide stress response transcriptional regulator
MREFEAACRDHGMPVTVQRLRIFAALLDRTDHPTPDQVYAAVKGTLPRVSRMTVYRVLDTLVGLDVIRKACAPGASRRVDPRTDRHHHLVCQRCDRLLDVEDTAVQHRIRMPDVHRQGFTIQGYSIYFTGLCAACQEQAAAAPSAAPPRKPRQSRGGASGRPARSRR